MDSRTQDAIELMKGFAERTGLTSERVPERYLWTDAFAVCTYFELARATGDDRYKQLGLRLIDQVHRTLGRHRADDPRTGWISGLGERAWEKQPTTGGLRIGKTLPERGPGTPYDERLEWDRDGQYFHYLTKWMHALDQATRATARSVFNEWARDLARTAYDAFTYVPDRGGRRRMYWKMSIDLSRPLVPSMGQHDPLDGYVTYLQLQTTASSMPGATSTPNLSGAIDQFGSMIGNAGLLSVDSLGLGGLLLDAARGAQLMRHGAPFATDRLETLLAAALMGLEHYLRQNALRQPATRRLAFRELGLAIGLHAVALTWKAEEEETERPGSSTTPTRVHALKRYAFLRTEIESFWRHPDHQRTSTWQDHRNINEVMLATSLAPEGLVVLRPPS